MTIIDKLQQHDLLATKKYSYILRPLLTASFQGTKWYLILGASWTTGPSVEFLECESYHARVPSRNDRDPQPQQPMRGKRVSGEITCCILRFFEFDTRRDICEEGSELVKPQHSTATAIYCLLSRLYSPASFPGSSLLTRTWTGDDERSASRQFV